MNWRFLSSSLLFCLFCFTTVLQGQSHQELVAQGQLLLTVSQNPALLDEVAAQEKQILDWIALAVDGDFRERWDASLQLAALGDKVVPYMIPYLADAREDLHRVHIIVALKKVGTQAVLPLVQALQTKDFFLQQNIAVVLKEIADPRSLGYLKWLSESNEVHAEVAPYALEAIKAIPQGASSGSAKEAFYRQALSYYYEIPVLQPLNPHHLWRNDQGRIRATIVPERLYYAALAEECCYKALQLDAENVEVWALLVCAYFKQYVQSRNLAKDVETATEISLSDEAKESYSQLEKNYVKKKVLASGTGVRHLMAGLQRAMQKNEVEVGVEILDALGEVSDEGDLSSGNPIFQALNSPHQMLRYASARTVVRINPTQSFSEASQVIPNLVEACNNPEVSLSASVAIASIDPNRSIFSLSGAVEGLIRLLSSENKEIKRAAIRSLGQVGVSTGLSPLAKVLLDTSEKADIRADAAWAIGEIFKLSGSLEAETYIALHKSIRDESQAVRDQCGLAIGKAFGLDPAKRFAMFRAEREGVSLEELETETITSEGGESSSSSSSSSGGDDDDDDSSKSGDDDDDDDSSSSSGGGDDDDDDDSSTKSGDDDDDDDSSKSGDDDDDDSSKSGDDDDDDSSKSGDDDDDDDSSKSGDDDDDDDSSSDDKDEDF